MKGKFIVRIDLCSDENSLIAEFVSLVNGTVFCRNAVYDSNNRVCQEDVTISIDTITKSYPVNNVEYLNYINKINKTDNDVSKKNIKSCSDVVISKSDIEYTSFNQSDDIINNSLLREDDKSIIEKQPIDLDLNTANNIKDPWDLRFLSIIIFYIRLLIDKIYSFTYFLRIRYNKETTKSNFIINRGVADTEVDFKFLVDDYRLTLIGLEKKNAVIAKVIENIIDVCTLDEKNDLNNKEIKNEETLISIINNAEEESTDKKQADEEIDDFSSLLTRSETINDSETKITEKVEDNKELLDLPEPTIVKNYNSPSFLRYLEDKKAIEKRYKKKLTLNEIRRIEEKRKNINSNGWQYGKQHYLYVSNKKKSYFDKKDICKYTGRYCHPFFTGQKVLYINNPKDLKASSKSKLNKKNKKNKDILDDKNMCRTPIIISSAVKSIKKDI